jgi:alkylated DNA repair dioxygenase AlkB
LAQLSLFGNDEPAFDATFSGAVRRSLGQGAWIEYVPSWLGGHARLFEALLRGTAWREGEQQMYDRIVRTPRLIAVLPQDGPGHPILEQARRVLSARYGEELVRTSLALYRDGADSVAWHGDRVARRMESALVVTVSLGSPRRFLLRPYGGGRSIAYNLGWGDLFVMGGSCQRTFQHSVPKLARAETRIAVMYRPFWEDPVPESDATVHSR